jgi:hypothetical protein
VPHGAFEEVINRICNNYNLKTSEIKMKKIFSRTKPARKLRVKHRGRNSPMTGIEALLLANILRHDALRQPVSCSEGLVLANSLIDGMVAQIDLMACKAMHLKNGTDENSFVTLGWRYWQIFCRWNRDVISSKKAVQFDSKRDDWSHLEMYDGVCDRLAEVGVAEVLDNEVWLDIHGNIVENEAESYRRKTKYLLRHPEKLIFVDEVGENISQKGDGNADSQKFVVTK